MMGSMMAKRMDCYSTKEIHLEMLMDCYSTKEPHWELQMDWKKEPQMLMGA
jgi:hypothetical protein